MQVFLPFFVSLAVFGSVVSVPNCPRSSPPYNDALFRQLGCGYDPRQVTAFEDGFQQPVITLTDTSFNVKLPDPSTANVLLPCEASNNFKQYAGDVRQDIDQVIESYSEFQKTVSSSGSIGLSNFLTSIGYSTHVQSLLKQESVTVFQYRAYRQARALLPITIPEEVQSWWNPDFAAAVKLLHPTNSTHSSYKNLIEGYGTHFVSRLVVGGFIAIYAQMEYCEYQREVKTSSSTTVKSTLLTDLSLEAKVKLGLSMKSTNKGLTSFSNGIRVGGNNTAYLKTGDVNQYIAGTEREKQTGVVAQGTRFVEIWKLLPENDTRRDLLQTAVNAYLAIQPTQSTGKQCSSASLSLSSLFTLLIAAIFACMFY